MTIFNDTADALGVAPEARNRAWAAVGAAGISPDDPEVVRLLVNEHVRSTMAALTSDLETAAGKAIREFGDAQAQGEAAASARLATRGTELAQSLSSAIATNVERTLDRRAEAKLNMSLATQWACGAILFSVGYYLGSLSIGYVDVPDDQITRWLQARTPWFLLSAGAVGFLALRLIVAWVASSPLIRFLLCLPPRESIRAWMGRDY